MSFPDETSGQTVQVFEPTPDAVYSIEAVAQIVCVSHRNIIIYCEQGLLAPAGGASDEGYTFNEEAIHLLRRIESLRPICGNNLEAVRLILDLMHEVDRLESEIRFLRQ